MSINRVGVEGGKGVGGGGVGTQTCFCFMVEDMNGAWLGFFLTPFVPPGFLSIIIFRTPTNRFC